MTYRPVSFLVVYASFPGHFSGAINCRLCAAATPQDERTQPLLNGEVSFGARIRRLRERAGLSQEALAERAGLGVRTLAALERDERRRPHPHTLANLTAALGLSPADCDALLDFPHARESAQKPPRSKGSLHLRAAHSTARRPHAVRLRRRVTRTTCQARLRVWWDAQTS